MTTDRKDGYFREHGDWARYDGGRLLFYTPVVAVGYDRKSGAVHRHGEPETVMKWHRKRVREVRAAQLDDIFDFAILSIPVGAPVSEADLNTCLDSPSNGAAMLAARLGLTL